MELDLNKTRGKDYWDKFLKLKKIPPSLFYYSDKLNKEEKKELFKYFVCIVNLETSTLCNRKCNYCPLSVYERNEQILIEDELYSNIFNDLASINYHSTISLNLYNEPLLDSKIFDRLREAREKCPNAFLKFNSNGDYLTKEILDKLVDAGLNAIFLTLHVPKGKKYNDEDRLNTFKIFFEKLGIGYEINEIIPSEKIISDVYYRGMRLLTEAHNWSEFGNDRGGTLEFLSSKIRTNPCVRPLREFTIAFDGRVYPCCQFYPDCESSDKYKIGTLDKNNSIFDLYVSKFLTDWRRTLFTFDKKLEPCKSCKDIDYSSLETKEKRIELLANAKNNDEIILKNF